MTVMHPVDEHMSHPSRRQILHGLAALTTPAALSFGAGSASARPTMIVATCFASDERGMAKLMPDLTVTKPLSHDAMLDYIAKRDDVVARTLILAPREHRQNAAGCSWGHLRCLGEAGLWSRMSPAQRDTGKIVTVGPVHGWSMKNREQIAAAYSCASLAAGTTTAIMGPSPGLGLHLGLHRVAPYFYPLPGLAIHEAWHGPDDLVAALSAHLQPLDTFCSRMDKVGPSVLRERGVQVIDIAGSIE